MTSYNFLFLLEALFIIWNILFNLHHVCIMILLVSYLMNNYSIIWKQTVLSFYKIRSLCMSLSLLLILLSYLVSYSASTPLLQLPLVWYNIQVILTLIRTSQTESSIYPLSIKGLIMMLLASVLFSFPWWWYFDISIA